MKSCYSKENFEKMDRTIGITSHSGVAKDIKKLNEQGCTDIIPTLEWIGSAPKCEGVWTDCSKLEPSGTWHAVDSSDSGDGSKCVWGEKVLCAHISCKDTDPRYDRRFNSFWIGEPSWLGNRCSTSPCDCIEQNAIPYMISRRGGGGEPCSSGHKQQCIKPPLNTPPAEKAEYDKIFADMSAACKKKQKFKQDLISKGTAILGDIVKAIPSVVDGSRDLLTVATEGAGDMLSHLSAVMDGTRPNTSLIPNADEGRLTELLNAVETRLNTPNADEGRLTALINAVETQLELLQAAGGQKLTTEPTSLNTRPIFTTSVQPAIANTRPIVTTLVKPAIADKEEPDNEDKNKISFWITISIFFFAIAAIIFIGIKYGPGGSKKIK